MRWFALLALLAVPGAQACSGAAPTSLDLIFDKQGCKRDNLDACPPLPEADVPYVAEGMLVWSWEFNPQCGVILPTESTVHIHIDGVERVNGGWFEVTPDPAEIYIDPATQWDITDDDVDPAAGTFRAREGYPIKVTFTLVGEPSPEALDRLDSKDGMLQLDLRASAPAVGSYDALTGMETFYFDGRSALEPEEPDDKSALDVPSLTPALALLAVALAALLRRN